MASSFASPVSAVDTEIGCAENPRSHRKQACARDDGIPDKLDQDWLTGWSVTKFTGQRNYCGSYDTFGKVGDLIYAAIQKLS